MPKRVMLAGIFAAGLFAAGAIAAVTALRPASFRYSDLSCPAAEKPVAQFELLFGARRKNAAPVGEEEWAAFLAAEVTPRFPDGITVFTGQGQWRGPDGVIIKETSRMLVIWYPKKDESGALIEAIRSAYKERFSQDSVLRADGWSCVSF